MEITVEIVVTEPVAAAEEICRRRGRAHEAAPPTAPRTTQRTGLQLQCRGGVATSGANGVAADGPSGITCWLMSDGL